MVELWCLMAVPSSRGAAHRQRLRSRAERRSTYYALVKGAAEGLGMQALIKDLGWKAKVRVNVDASAAKSVASRVGIEKIRHLDVEFRWIQEVDQLERFGSRKSGGYVDQAKKRGRGWDLLKSGGQEG